MSFESGLTSSSNIIFGDNKICFFFSLVLSMIFSAVFQLINARQWYNMRSNVCAFYVLIS